MSDARQFYTDQWGRLRSLDRVRDYSQTAPRPVTAIRPLAIGAAYSDEFETLAPCDWSAAIVLAQLFKMLPMENAGWNEKRMELRDLGAQGDARRWLVRRT